MVKIQTFKGKDFKVIKGSVHPEYSYHTFELEEHDFRDKYWSVKDGDIVLDIGSSYGSYALTACAMGATVYAFEPEKTVYCDLVNNINVNSWQNKCFPFNMGLWSSTSIVDMKTYAPHWPAQTISDNFHMETIDKVVSDNNINKIDWMKIDTEGAEVHAVLGGLNTIKKFHPQLIIECHTFLDEDILNKVKGLLSSVYNYEFEEIDRPPCKMLLAHSK